MTRVERFDAVADSTLIGDRKAQAEEVAKTLGHHPGPWTSYHPCGPEAAITYCMRCRASLIVTTLGCCGPATERSCAGRPTA